MPNFDWSNRCHDISILDLSRWWQPQSWIFRILHFNDPNGQEGRTASMCQILSKSIKPRRYVSFRFFKMAAAAILDFWNFKFFTGGTVKRIELHHSAKLRQNHSNRGWDITIFDFSKMAAVRHLGFVMRVWGPPTNCIWWSLSLCKMWLESMQ